MFPVLSATLSCGLLLYAAVAGAVSPYSAEYDLKHGILSVGSMTRTLTIEGDRYTLESRLQAGGLVSLFSDSSRVETSRGRLAGTRFVPEHYVYDRAGSRKDYALRFDYAAARVQRAEADQSWQADLPEGAQDLLTYLAQLMVDLPHAAEKLSYTVVAKNKLKIYDLEVLGNEVVKTAFGDFDTVKVRRADGNSKKRTTVWFAEALGWIPVSVEYRDKRGNTTRASLRKLRSDRTVLGNGRQ